jgi:hypothetical protein
MTTTKSRLGAKLTLVTGMICASLLAIGLTSLVQAAPVDIPPRPPKPTPQPTSQPAPQTIPVGALIELHVQFPEEGLEFHWQELWTIVQWQDEFGHWHNVEGWQGTLDEVVGDESRQKEGQKVWWLASDLFGKGLFRWMVYRTRGSELVAESDSFFLPSSANEVVKVEMALAP